MSAPVGYRFFRDLPVGEILALKRLHSEGHTIQYWQHGDTWKDCPNPRWVELAVYRVKPDGKPTGENELATKTVGGLQAIEWIKARRAKTGCSLYDAKKEWDALPADSEADKDAAFCTIIEVDIEKDRLVIQMTSKQYSVGPGLYKLVRLDK